MAPGMQPRMALAPTRPSWKLGKAPVRLDVGIGPVDDGRVVAEEETAHRRDTGGKEDEQQGTAIGVRHGTNPGRVAGRTGRPTDMRPILAAGQAGVNDRTERLSGKLGNDT